MSSKRTNRPKTPDEQDMQVMFEYCRNKLGLEGRVLIDLDFKGELRVRSEVFRLENGVRVGISAFEEHAHVFDKGLTGAMFRTLVSAYWQADGLAHTGFSAMGRLRNPKG